MIESLREIESLLRKHGHPGQADAVRRVLEAEQRGDRDAFAHEATGLSLWGGAGSVADTNLRYDSPAPAAEADADARRFHCALIALADALEQRNLATARIRELAVTFRRWVAQGV